MVADPNNITLDDYRKHQARKMRGKTKGRKKRNEEEGRPAKQYGAMPNDPPVVQSCLKRKNGTQSSGPFPKYKKGV